MSKLIIRPATREDIDELSSLEGKPTVRAWCAELDGKPVALGGIAHCKGRWLAFFGQREEAEAYPITVARNAIRFFDQMRESGITFIYAERDFDEPTSGRWLESLGFELDPKSNYFYRWRA